MSQPEMKINSYGTKRWYLNGKLYSFEDYLVKLEKLGYEDQATNLLFKLDEV